MEAGIKIMTVTFCGHAQVSDEAAVRVWLDDVIMQLCQQGVGEFLLGGYGVFDALAAAVVWEAKKQFENITSFLVLPYLDAKPDLSFYDGSLYPPLENVPKQIAIVKRNQWMVNTADIVVAYVLHNWGGAAKTYEYAIQKKKQIICFPNVHVEGSF